MKVNKNLCKPINESRPTAIKPRPSTLTSFCEQVGDEREQLKGALVVASDCIEVRAAQLERQPLQCTHRGEVGRLRESCRKARISSWSKSWTVVCSIARSHLSLLNGLLSRYILLYFSSAPPHTFLAASLILREGNVLEVQRCPCA